jgi:hypothetical protein
MKNALLEVRDAALAAGIAAGEPFPTGIDRAKGDGVTTCLLHRAHEWSAKYYAPLMPLCTICGGRCDPRQTAHPLCVERSKRGLPTPQLDSFAKCGCAKCTAENR